MKIFKFGGASIKDAEGVKNVARIIGMHRNEKLVIVISAMGKITNALENLCHTYFYKDGSTEDALESIKTYHYDIAKALFPGSDKPVFHQLNNLFVELEWVLEEEPSGDYDFVYDQIVSIGEMLSSRIVSSFLEEQQIKNAWIDVRDCIFTDDAYRKARVKWEQTVSSIQEVVKKSHGKGDSILITQGFLGVTSENYTTTLGREGSDYSAAIFAYALDAKGVVIWKDVPGVLNADPRYFPDAILLKRLSYQDAIELAYYGASVIHPKTIQPLQNKSIELCVRSFLDLDQPGTFINQNTQTEPFIPSYIFKSDQVLISISARDLSFIIEENLSEIFAVFNKHKSSINMMQNSAISFSVCTDNSERLETLVSELQEKYKVLYNSGLQLLTIRHYTAKPMEDVTFGQEILLEQRSRNTLQLVLK